MNRDKLVEQAAQALSDWDADLVMGAEDNPLHDENDLDAVRAVLNTVLPQVTTVAELEALPLGSIVVSHNGYPFERSFDNEMSVGGEFKGSVTDIVNTFAPLTVVWTPEESARG